MIPLDDNLLDALHAARPTSGDESATSIEAQTMLNKILDLADVTTVRWPRRRWALAVPIGIAVAVAVAATVMVGQSGTHPPSIADGSTPTPANLRTAILTAMDSTTGQIEYSQMTSSMPGEPRSVRETWIYPTQAKPGEQVKFRQRRDQNGTGYRDVGMSYIVPRGTKSITTRLIDVEYPTRTWSDQKKTRLETEFGYGGGGAVPIRQRIASGAFKVDGRVMLNGRPAIELSWDPTPRLRSQLWVDARTYQLVKTVFQTTVGSPGNMVHGTDVTTYKMLPATTSNLASLSPVIPAGFTRTATQPPNG